MAQFLSLKCVKMHQQHKHCTHRKFH